MKTPMMMTIIALALLASAANAGTIEMKVYGLVCGFCAQGIEKTLRKNPATADVVVSLENKLVAVATRDGPGHFGRRADPGAHRLRLRRQGNHAHAEIDRRHPRRAQAGEMMDPLKRNVGVAFGSLLASSATLVCCVLPAVMVSLGAGAALVGLISAFPQLVWLSEHKGWVFGIAGVLLAASGAMLWHARSLPCPADPAAARSCMRLRRLSALLYVIAVGGFSLGALYAFVLPVVSRV